MAELTEKQLLAQIVGLTEKIAAEKNKGTSANQQTITAWQSQIKPMAQTVKELRSKRLANMRVNNALQKIGLIENLATGNYCYTDEQKLEIITALSDAVVGCDNAFKTKQVLTAQFCI